MGCSPLGPVARLAHRFGKPGKPIVDGRSTQLANYPGIVGQLVGISIYVCSEKVLQQVLVNCVSMPYPAA